MGNGVELNLKRFQNRLWGVRREYNEIIVLNNNEQWKTEKRREERDSNNLLKVGFLQDYIKVTEKTKSTIFLTDIINNS